MSAITVLITLGLLSFALMTLFVHFAYLLLVAASGVRDAWVAGRRGASQCALASSMENERIVALNRKRADSSA